MLWSTLFFAAVAVAAPSNSLVLHEKRDISPYSSIKGKRVDPTAVIPIRIALTQRNLENGYEHLMDVSHPASANYGKHWTIDEIHDMYRPLEGSVEAVRSWLESIGFHRDDIAQTASHGWLSVNMPAGDAERVFKTEYYEHVDGLGNVRVGCDEYHLPSDLSPHVDYITPGVSLSAPLSKIEIKRDIPVIFPGAASRNYTHAPNISATSLDHCGHWITPACIKALYQIPTPQCVHPENAIGVFETGSTYDQVDLNLFFSHYAPWVPNGTHPSLVSINNGTAPTKPSLAGDEPIGDFDIVFPLVYPQAVTLYQVLPTKAQNLTSYEALLDAVDGSYCTEAERKSGADCGTANLTRVLTTSYGGSEIDFAEAAINRACNEYLKLGLKGHSLFFSTGDYGPGVTPPYVLTNGKGKITNGCLNATDLLNPEVNGTIFNPQFPATCPFVTAVGATQLHERQTINDTESAMLVPSSSLPPIWYFGSSGGFSNYLSPAPYQAETLSNYFKVHNTTYPTYAYNETKKIGANGGLYNRNGRGIPDVSANGDRNPIFLGGAFGGPVAGTSLAAPIWASIISMINDERTDAGKGPVGFINPVLYAHPEILNDITKGRNPGCGTEGFEAVEGWDPVTGLGTPNYPKILELFMSLP